MKLHINYSTGGAALKVYRLQQKQSVMLVPPLTNKNIEPVTLVPCTARSLL